MFFFQDDIGLLIQLQNIPFWRFLFTPQAEHFAPILHILSWSEYRLFGLNFTPYVMMVVLIHVLNCVVLAKIIHKITRSFFLAFLGVSFFIINLTYTEPFLWFAANGVVIATLFSGLSFFFWYKFIMEKKIFHFLYSVAFILFSGFSFGTGVALGVVFTAVTFIYKEKIKTKLFLKVILIYFIIGLFSYFIGPFIAQDKIDRVIPLIKSPIKDGILYIGFIIAGIARGVIGRFFLPGFEPRHFQIIPTIISFLPFVIICLANLWLLMIKGKRQEKMLLITLSIFITYPYVWAGFLRSHFGLKQALAERYAYPSLFFFCVLLVLLIKQFIDRGFIESRKLIAIFAVVILILQSLVFIRNAIRFEEKPLKTKDYFGKLERVLQNSATVIDFSLPSYINQEYRISQLSTVLKVSSFPKYVLPSQDFCTVEFLKGFKREEILSFYKEQVKDPIIVREFSKELLNDCLSKIKKSV